MEISTAASYETPCQSANDGFRPLHADGTVRVLALDIDDLIDLARSRLTRSWTQDECQTYLHRDTCPDS